VLPAERCDVSEEIVGNRRALGTQLSNGAVEVDRVPMDDGGRDEAEARRTKALVLKGCDPGFPPDDGRTPRGVARCWLRPC
jgi:hypothetical protein